MVDTAAQPHRPGKFEHGSLVAGSRRLRKRRAAETRLKAYGIIAIAVAASALIALLGSVILQATSALTEHYVVAEVTLDRETLGLEEETSNVARGDYDELVEKVMRDAFPNATGRSASRTR